MKAPRTRSDPAKRSRGDGGRPGGPCGMRRGGTTRGLALGWALGLLVLPAPSVWAGSLWSDDSINLFSNHKAMHVGDIVTIIIVEDASASNQSQMKLTKENKADLDASGSGKLDFIPLLGGKMDYKKEQQGKGQMTLAGKMNARVTATVVEIRPNGNLVVEGSRQVVINDEADQITVAGVIRPEDIAADNTVLSTYLSEGQISYTGSGALKQSGRQGLIARFLDLLF